MEDTRKSGGSITDFSKIFFPDLFLKSGQKITKDSPFITLLAFSKLAKRTVPHADVEAPTPR